MAPRARPTGLVLLLAIGLALGYVGWLTLRSSEAAGCQACGRAIHAESETTALADGERGRFCCPTCALTLHRQTDKEVRVVELTDHVTGEKIQPDAAYIVHESDVNLCVRHDMLRMGQSDTTPLEFDRCAPSMIAFESRAGAERFVEQHGGVVVPFKELRSAYTSP